MAEGPSALVFDLASGCMRGGFGGDDAPRAVFPTIIGTFTTETSSVHISTTGRPRHPQLGTFMMGWQKER